ncbi:4Fe-4S cluster-binding domain-containing protein [Candidatus Poribacteria bacterium]|nr:4Fe-4S cluster-binding domain-containing protein [Candidatus Poribacteria bacterium]
MELTGLHILLTFQCNLECDHCFVWGSPKQKGIMTKENVQNILDQAKELSTIKWIYFEGGEPFLFYTILFRGVFDASKANFKVGIVSNGYWAKDISETNDYLKPFVGLVNDLSISSDLFHSRGEKISQQAKNACEIAEKIKIPCGLITIAKPMETCSNSVRGQLPLGESKVMYRGRAAEKLAKKSIQKYSWTSFTSCPHEDLQNPSRVHVDPFGNLHICQGITIGNMFNNKLIDICNSFDANLNPIIKCLINGGPAELVRYYNLVHEETYADACHLCYEARKILRIKFPEILKPDQMYGKERSG